MKKSCYYIYWPYRNCFQFSRKMNKEELKIKKNDVNLQLSVAMATMQWLCCNEFVAMFLLSCSSMFTNKAIILFDKRLYRKILTRLQGLLTKSVKMLPYLYRLFHNNYQAITQNNNFKTCRVLKILNIKNPNFGN